MVLRIPFKKEEPPKTNSMDQVFELQPHVRSMSDPNGAVLLDLEAGRYYSLNGIGARIWSKAGEGLTLAEILRDLQACYQVPSERLESDLTAFIRGMEEKGLVRVRA